MKYVARLARYARKRASLLVFSLVGMVAFTGLSLMPPLLLRYLINDVVQAAQWQLLAAVIAMIIAVPIATSLVQFSNTMFIMLAGNRLVADIRKDVYGKIMELPLKFHQDHSSGVLVNRLMDDVNMLQRLITGDTVNMIIDIIVVLASVSIVGNISWLLAGILAGTLILYAVAYRIFARRIERSTAAYRSMQDRISERLQETIAGVKHVRIYNRENVESAHFQSRTVESMRHAYAGTRGNVALGTVCNLIAGFGSAAILIIGNRQVIAGSLSYGDIVAVNAYIWMVLNPAIRLTGLAGQLTETFVSVGRVFELLDEPVTIHNDRQVPAIRAAAGRVEFRDVDFAYTANAPLYQALSLVVEPGMTVALVGHTGCGKSTLTQLLMRHWDIQGGSIMVDGQDIRTVNLASLRRLFGVVLQESILFDGSLAENIAYGKADATPADIERAARAAEIHELAERLPGGYQGIIGTHGAKLSLGEKQRLAIARAVLKEPLIMIMDEATSSLDSRSEALIQKALKKVLKGRTSFVVAHRLSTITGADLIVVMDHGAIIEQGSHEALMAREHGLYRRYYEELSGGTSRMMP